MGLVIAVAGFIYANRIEPRWIRVKQTTIPIQTNVPEKLSLRIVHLTDFHLSSAVGLDYLTSVFRQTAALHPDLICITGDFYTDHLRQGAAYANALRILPGSAPTFACPGNHDFGVWARERGGYPEGDSLRTLLRNSGITLLENADAILKVRGQRIMVGGLGDIWAISTPMRGIQCMSRRE